MNRSNLIAACLLTAVFTLSAAVLVAAWRIQPAAAPPPYPAPFAVAAAPGTPAVPPPSFTVTGTATLDVEPDTADLHVTLNGSARRPGAAVKAARARQATLIAALVGLGIDQKDIALSQLAITPTYTERRDQWGNSVGSEITGYQATIQVTASTHDFDLIGSMMDAAADAGAGEMRSTFRAADLSAFKEKVRAMALEAVKAKAEQISSALGVDVGRVTAIAEDGAIDRWQWGHGYTGGVSNDYAVAPSGSPSATTADLQPLTLSMTVTYRLD